MPPPVPPPPPPSQLKLQTVLTTGDNHQRSDYRVGFGLMSAAVGRAGEKSPRKPTSSQKAQEVLKKAINNGTIDTILWGKDAKMEKKRLRERRGPRTVAEVHRVQLLQEFRDYLQDARLMNDVAIWNKALMIRVTDVKKQNQGEQTELDILIALLDELDELKGQLSPGGGDRSDATNNNNNDSNNAARTKDNNNDSSDKTRKTDKKRKKKLKNKASEDESNPESNLTESHVSNTAAPSSPKQPADAANIKNFDALPILDKKGDFYLGSIRKPKRVSQIIKSTKGVQQIQALVLQQQQQQQQALQQQQAQSPSKKSSSDSQSGNENSDSMDSSASSADEDVFGEDDGFDRFDSGGGARWGGLSTTMGRDSKIRKSIDVVAGLFQMSNELREERESIRTRTAKDGGGLEAFINRETTMKYNNELEEVAKSKQDTAMTQRRAALLRVRKRVQIYHSLRTNPLQRWQYLWETMQPYRKVLLDPEPPLLQLPDKVDAGYFNTNMSFMSNGHTGLTVASFLSGPNGIAHSNYSGGEKGRAQTPPTPPDVRTPPSEPSEAAEVPEQPHQQEDLATMFEHDISMLFTTKRKAKGLKSVRSRQRRESDADLGGYSPTSANATSNRKVYSTRLELYGSVEGEAGRDAHNDNDSDKGVSVAGDGDQDHEDAIREANQRNLNAIIQKMKSMGVYKTESFNVPTAPEPPHVNLEPPLNLMLPDTTGDVETVHPIASSHDSPKPQSISPNKPPHTRQHFTFDNIMTDEDTLSPTSKRLQPEDNEPSGVVLSKVDISYEPQKSITAANLSAHSQTFDPMLSPSMQKWLGSNETKFESEDKSSGSNVGEFVTQNSNAAVEAQASPLAPPINQKVLRLHTVNLFASLPNPPSAKIAPPTADSVRCRSPKQIVEGRLANQVLSLQSPTAQRDDTINGAFQGRWGYDQSVKSKAPNRVNRRSEMAHSTTIANDIPEESDALSSLDRKALLLQQHAEARARSRQEARERKRQKRRLRDAFKTLSARKDIYREILFNAQSHKLCLLFKEGEEILFCIAVPIDSIFVTDNPLSPALSHAVQTDLVLLRTKRLDLLPTGYIGGFSASQWNEIEKEMNKGLRRESRRLQRRIHSRGAEKRASVALPLPSPSQIPCDAPATAAAERNNVFSLTQGETGASNNVSTKVAFADSISSPVVERAQDQEFNDEMSGSSDDLNLNRSAEINSDDGDEDGVGMIIPRMPGLLTDFPVTSPALTQALPLSLMRALRSQRKQQKWLLSTRHREEDMTLASMGKIRMDRPGDATSREPHRYRKLIADVETAQKPPTLCADDADAGADIAVKRTVEKAPPVDLSKQLLQSSFRLAAQSFPVSLAPPVLEPVRDKPGDGYVAAGFAACNQPVTFTLHGLPRTQQRANKVSVAGANASASDTRSLENADRDHKLQEAVWKFEHHRQQHDDSFSFPFAPLSLARHTASFRTKKSRFREKDVTADAAMANRQLTPASILKSTRTSRELALSEIFQGERGLLLSAQSGKRDAQDVRASSAPAAAAEDITAGVTPKKPKFSYEYQIIILIETRRLMQLYFAKKFLQLDLAVNVHLTPYDVTESLLDTPELYGCIFISFLDLQSFGIEKSLRDLIPPSLNKSRYSIVVYDVSEDDEDSLDLLEQNGIFDVLYPPYTIGALKTVLDAHESKQNLLLSMHG